MKFSIITPTHNPQFLGEAYESLLAQTYSDWEWVIVPNNGAVIPDTIAKDHQVRVVPHESSNVGALKHFGFMAGVGEWLVELDHDDQLMPNALDRILEHEEADFVYSNCFELTMEGVPRIYPASGGWVYSEEWLGPEKKPVAITASAEYPSNVSRIWYAPNHLRAWKREFYHRIGGHNPDLTVCDDADLMCRTYLEGSMKHIDEALYVQRFHDDQSWLKHNAEIQVGLWDVHNAYFDAMAQLWSRRKGLRLVDLGGALDSPAGFESYDRHNADIVGDLNDTWKLESGSVGYLRAWDVLEHLRDPIHVMNEAYRVLAHGGVFDIWVPSTRGEGAFCDPTHVSFWNKRSFRYYTDPNTRRYIEPECQAKFQVITVDDIDRWDERIPYVHAQLTAVKDGPRLMGESSW